jgi:hypothetical protein
MGRPVVFITAGCLAHQRGIRSWLVESWPFDPVTGLGVDDADYWISALLDEMSEDGPVLTSHGVA